MPCRTEHMQCKSIWSQLGCPVSVEVTSTMCAVSSFKHWTTATVRFGRKSGTVFHGSLLGRIPAQLLSSVEAWEDCGRQVTGLTYRTAS